MLYVYLYLEMKIEEKLSENMKMGKFNFPTTLTPPCAPPRGKYSVKIKSIPC